MMVNISEADGFIESPAAIAKLAGARALALRLAVNRTRDDVARAAGVGVMTLRRFELTGRANFEAIVRIAIVLGDDRAIGALFLPRDFRTLDEVIDAQVHPLRRRARRKRAT